VVWVPCFVVAAFAFLTAVDGAVVRHWWNFSKPWALAGIGIVYAILTAVSAVGAAAYIQLDSAAAASGTV
jgi:hypothetical protein